ncbi:MAG: cytochrome c oxidase assembly protein [Marmoricola sp.]
MHMGALAPLGWHSFATTWDLHVGWVVAGLLLLLLYGAAARSARRRGRPLAAWRIVAFVVGVALLETTIASAIDAYAMAVFWMHMVLHLTLIMVVPVLLVLGSPLRAVVDGLEDTTRDAALDVLRSGPVAVLTHPLVGLAVYAFVIVGTHLTGFMDAMATSDTLMTGEQVVYVVAGVWLLVPLIGDEPIRWKLPHLVRIGLLLVAMVPDTVVGIVLLQTGRDLFPTMMGMRPGWAPDAVADLQTAGGLMWAAGDGLMMFIAVGVLVAFLSRRDGQERTFGTWLESARRQALIEHVGTGGEQLTGDIDPDGEEALAAYNRMLQRLNGGS